MTKMPVLFVGHGSPMNAIEDKHFTCGWEKLADRIPRPKAILVISAHWTTPGTKVTDSLKPRQIYDMYGFPRELYEVVYEPAGAPEIAQWVPNLTPQAEIDNSWGLDHGAWSVLKRIYPEADIPVFQMSLDQSASRQYHYETGRRLKPLRDQGVLILGSGNIVHHLGLVNWSLDGGYDWAVEFDQYIKSSILNRDHESVIDYRQAGECAHTAVPTTEHFDPMLYVLEATDDTDQIFIFNEMCTLGSISMTSYLFE